MRIGEHSRFLRLSSIYFDSSVLTSQRHLIILNRSQIVHKKVRKLSPCARRKMEPARCAGFFVSRRSVNWPKELNLWKGVVYGASKNPKFRRHSRTGI
jgi:hypothetical protein